MVCVCECLNNNSVLFIVRLNFFRYLKQFDTDTRRSFGSMNFEKSATYFDSSLAMKRIKALLPSVHLIIMLTEPGARAYSRYQVNLN